MTGRGPGRLDLIARAAAHYAPLIAAVIRRSADPQAVAAASDPAAFLAAHPPRADLAAVLDRLYRDAAHVGIHEATTSRKIAKAAATDSPVDWATWTPGDPAGADTLADGSWQRLLDQADITIRGVDDTTMSRMATVLSQGAGEGWTADRIAEALDGMLDDPARAAVIATTELNRGVSAATLDQYKQDGVPLKAWMTADDACPVCQDNEDAGPIPVDDDFPSGDEAPGAHPSCLCALTAAYPEG